MCRTAQTLLDRTPYDLRMRKDKRACQRSVSVILIASLLGAHIQAAQSSEQGTQAERIEATIRSRGVGERATVMVELRDGKKLKGYIWEAQDDSFTLVQPNPQRPTSLLYSDVANVEKGRSEWAKLLIFVGATIGVAAGGIAIALIAADPH
jgi:hypothetical protein